MFTYSALAISFKMLKKIKSGGLRPDPTGGAYKRSPDP